MSEEIARVYIFEKYPLGNIVELNLLAKYPKNSSNVVVQTLQPALDALSIKRPMEDIPDAELFDIAWLYFERLVSAEDQRKSIVVSHVSTEGGLDAALELVPMVLGVIARLPDQLANRHDLDLVSASKTLKNHKVRVIPSRRYYEDQVPLHVSQILKSR